MTIFQKTFVISWSKSFFESSNTTFAFLASSSAPLALTLEWQRQVIYGKFFFCNTVAIRYEEHILHGICRFIRKSALVVFI